MGCSPLSPEVLLRVCFQQRWLAVSDAGGVID